MMTWADILVAGLWRAGWAVVPVALVVAVVCRFGKCNATTRHALWLTTFAGLLAAMWLPGPKVEPPPAPEPVYFIGSQNGGVGFAPPMSFVPLVNGGRSTRYAAKEDEKATTAQVAAHVEPTPPRTAACSADSSAAWLASTANRLRRLSIPLLEQFERGREWVRELGSERCCESRGDDPAGNTCNEPAQLCCEDTSDCDAVCGGSVDSPLVGAATSATNWITAIPGMIASGISSAHGEMTDAITSAALNSPQQQQSEVESISAANLASALSSLGPVRTTSNPDELDPWPGEPGAEYSAAAEWQRFVSRLLGVRDAAGLVPPLPTTAWGVGFMVVAGLLLGRTISAARRLRRAVPADADTLRLVEREARRLGLKSAPETLLIEDRVSPLIWCGNRVRLILPRSFWTDLDYDARRAVICHELAHLRRRDHWVRRLEILVTCLYWWHPVMWYVKARMAEEADACCDEWVTWVLPRERRAYARALLAATDFVSGSVAPKPFAVAMASARAAKIARRLTMIMTATRRPSLGLAGICGIFALAALAWVATPAQSCPPEEQEATTAHNHKHDLAADAVHVVKARNTGETGDEAGEGGEGDDATPPNDAEMADRLRRIEETQKKLAAELRELSGHMDKHGEATSAPRATQSWSSNSTTPTPSAPMATSAGMGHRSPFAQTVPGGGFATVIAGPRPGFEQPVVSRKYKLSGDRLEALTELMSRDDVPVLISPSDDGIEVQGTESQQAIFAAFIKMITANEKAAEVKLPEEKMAALKKLAALDSVPTKFQIGEDSITVQGSAAEQAVFDAFIALIHPKTTAESAGSMTRTLDVAPIPAIPPVSPFAPPATPAPAGAIKRKPKAAQPAIAPGSAAAEAAADQVASAELAKVRSDAESQLKANQDAIKKEMQVVRAGLDAKRAELKSRRADLTAQQNQLEGQADHLEAEADSVENRAKMADDANETQKLNQQAREMRRQARQSRRDATRLNTQIDKLVEAITQMEIEAAGASR